MQATSSRSRRNVMKDIDLCDTFEGRLLPKAEKMPSQKCEINQVVST
jgi:hypothetical protein